MKTIVHILTFFCAALFAYVHGEEIESEEVGVDLGVMAETPEGEVADENLLAKEETAPNVIQSWSTTLLDAGRNPFIPFNAAPVQENRVLEESQDLELTGYSIGSDQSAFSLKDKVSGKSFWLYSDDVNPHQGYTFKHFDETEKIVTLQNEMTGEFFSIRLVEPKETKAGNKAGMFSDNLYDYSGNGNDFSGLGDDLDLDFLVE